MKNKHRHPIASEASTLRDLSDSTIWLNLMVIFKIIFAVLVDLGITSFVVWTEGGTKSSILLPFYFLIYVFPVVLLIAVQSKTDERRKTPKCLENYINFELKGSFILALIGVARIIMCCRRNRLLKREVF